MPRIDTRFAVTPTLRIAYERNPVQNGRSLPIVLLHRRPDDARTWKRVAEKLHARGHQTFTPWLRVFGETSFMKPDTPRSGQVVALAQDVIDLLDVLSISKAAIVDHDWEEEQHMRSPRSLLFRTGRWSASLVMEASPC